jgi:hypothetical protein
MTDTRRDRMIRSFIERHRAGVTDPFQWFLMQHRPAPWTGAPLDNPAIHATAVRTLEREHRGRVMHRPHAGSEWRRALVWIGRRLPPAVTWVLGVLLALQALGIFGH